MTKSFQRRRTVTISAFFISVVGLCVWVAMGVFDTEYAAGFSEIRFSGVRLGQTRQAVFEQLGEPI